MAADATYPSRPYHHRDGTFRVPSGSTVYVEDGGYITVQSGGYLKLDAGAVISATGASLSDAITVGATGTLTNNGAIDNQGTIINSSDGYYAESATLNQGSSAAGGLALVGYGVSLIGSSTAAVREYKLNRPVHSGVSKTLICMGTTGLAGIVVISATATAQACKFQRTLTKISFVKPTTLKLIAATSTDWHIEGFTTAALVSYHCT